MIKEKSDNITIIDNDDYSKPNFLISAKYKSSLMANKVLAISLSRLQEAEDSKDGVLISDIKASEKKTCRWKPGQLLPDIGKDCKGDDRTHHWDI